MDEKKTRPWRLWARIAFWGAFAAALLGAWAFLTQPVWVLRRQAAPGVNPRRLETDVRTLSESCFPRDSEHVANLERAARFIFGEMSAAGGETRFESFTVRGKAYHNVIAEFGPPSTERVVVGAHYDSCGEHPAADDNASGVAGLLAVARLLGQSPPPCRVEAVAFTLEEPPYFGSPLMGSAVRAEASKKAGEKIKAMLCLEMMGRYSDVRGSQHYPSALFYLLYPSRGNFLALVGRPREVSILRRAKRAFRSASDLPVRSITAPPSLFFAMTLSDHSNYWDAGYPALMATDTAFLRNLDYHTDEDTPAKLDYTRMAQAVQGLHAAVIELCR